MRIRQNARRPKTRDELAGWYEELLREQRTRGASISEVAAQAGVTPTTLYAWRRRLRAGQGKESTPRTGGLVRVRVQQGDQERRPTPPPLVVRLADGRSVEVPHGFDADELRRLLDAVSQC